jgi:acyl CoA:acetate/3-ketoacid CoA transferase beta subunit
MTAATIVRLTTEMAVIETQPGHKMAVIETQPGGSDRERKTEGPSDPKAKLIINK